MSNTQLLKELYSAINRNDILAALQLFDPKIVRVEPVEFPAAGTYRGLDEMKAHLIQGRESWAEGSCEPEEFLEAHNKIIVTTHVRVKLKSTQKWIEGYVADAFAFQNGKIIKWNSFSEKQQALEWSKSLSS